MTCWPIRGDRQATVTPYLGRYANADRGEVTLSLQEDVRTLDRARSLAVLPDRREGAVTVIYR